MIIYTNTIIDPIAMMIHSKYASVAELAVVSPRWFLVSALLALLVLVVIIQLIQIQWFLHSNLLIHTWFVDFIIIGIIVLRHLLVLFVRIKFFHLIILFLLLRLRSLSLSIDLSDDFVIEGIHINLVGWGSSWIDYHGFNVTPLAYQCNS